MIYGSSIKLPSKCALFKTIFSPVLFTYSTIADERPVLFSMGMDSSTVIFLPGSPFASISI
ncbi:MAG: hypothetical protein GY754_30030 [bacterium]|nr:hypothetical protein [bacterium]